MLCVHATGSPQPIASDRTETERAPMAKRMILTLVILVAVVAALGFVKFKQIQVAIAEGAAFQPPPEAVTTVVAKDEQ